MNECAIQKAKREGYHYTPSSAPVLANDLVMAYCKAYVKKFGAKKKWFKR